MSHDELPLDHVNDCDRAPVPLPPARHLFDPRGHDAGDEDAGTTGERISLLMSKIDTHRPPSITLDDGVVLAEIADGPLPLKLRAPW